MKCCLYIFTIFLLGSCAQSRFVEPLNKNELSIGASLGGSVIDYAGAPIPLPLTNIELGYGIDSNITLHGGWHTSAAFFGNAQFDFGATFKILNQKKYRPNVSISPAMNIIYNFDDKSGRLWPMLDANAYWNYGKRSNYFYLGFNNYFELRTAKADNQPQGHHWIFNPQIGHIIKGKNKPWQFSFEVKFLAPYVDNSTAFIPYKSLFGKWGATGVYLGFRYPLTLKK